MLETVPKTIRLIDYQAPLFSVKKVSLNFLLDEETKITVMSEIERIGEHDHALHLDGEHLELIKVAINGETLSELDYELDAQGLTIQTVPDQFTLEVVTGVKPKLNTSLSGLYQSSGNFCTQCEAEGFRRITYFLDRPDVLAEYDVTLQADKNRYPVLLANGNLVAKGDHDDGSHWAKWHDPHPKPCYLFAIVAGQLENITDHYTTRSGETVELNIYTQKHNIAKCNHAMASLKNAMRWDEEVYGLEYDLSVYNIVAVDDFNMGAMENKGLNIFNSKYVLADQQTATDADYQAIESVIGHEYFHNWSGNRVTCRDWFQLSLKEGFTVFRDQEFSADMGSRSIKRIRDVEILRTYQFKEDAGPMAHPVRPDSYQEINNFYTVTIYDKGAEVIRMLYQLIGVEGFRAATDLYFQRFDGQAVTTDDFVNCIEEANEVDLSQFRLWYTQAGTPELTVTQHYDTEQKTMNLGVRQFCPPTPGQPSKQAFQIPMAVALIGEQGDVFEEKVLTLTEEHQEFLFEGVESRPVVSFLRDFSAPVKVDFPVSDEELAHLVRFDDNGFSRCEAMQRLCLNILVPTISQDGSELDEAKLNTLINLIKELIQNPPSDMALFAELLTMPQLSYIADQSKPIQPQRVCAVYSDFSGRLAKALKADFYKLYLENSKRVKRFDLTFTSMARRSLQAILLQNLILCDEQSYYELAECHYQNADNMTDRLAAFSALLKSDYSQKSSLIEDFYETWKNEVLVVDKWFSMQARMPDGELISRIQELAQHPDFSIKNPNNVGALIGAFSGNMFAFHRKDGAGYAFLADKVIELNAINPQVGARLVGVFNAWRDYADPFSSLMKEQLERIALTPKLSKDISEIVNKALNMV